MFVARAPCINVATSGAATRRQGSYYEISSFKFKVWGAGGGILHAVVLHDGVVIFLPSSVVEDSTSERNWARSMHRRAKGKTLRVYNRFGGTSGGPSRDQSQQQEGTKDR